VVTPPAGLADLSVLARGGYSTVYRATQLSVGRQVALKVDNRTLDTAQDRNRFRSEARAAGRVSGHPNVVDLFDAGVTLDGHPYLVMELCTGSYADRMDRRDCGPAEVRRVGMRIADALAAAHRAGVLHRDVKPGNILTTRYDTPVLADFGLAVLLDGQRDLAVELDALTPAYAPPELFRLDGAGASDGTAGSAGSSHRDPVLDLVPVQPLASAASQPTAGVAGLAALPGAPSAAGDVYSLAATLYALLAGHPPRLPGAGTPTVAVLLELFDQPVPELPGLPPALTGLLRAGMANDPAARPSAARFRDLLAATPVDHAEGTAAAVV
jgi:serine/threonine protein kinase